VTQSEGAHLRGVGHRHPGLVDGELRHLGSVTPCQRGCDTCSGFRTCTGSPTSAQNQLSSAETKPQQPSGGGCAGTSPRVAGFLRAPLQCHTVLDVSDTGYDARSDWMLIMQGLVGCSSCKVWLDAHHARPDWMLIMMARKDNPTVQPISQCGC
jgi:hypothetical protein